MPTKINAAQRKDWRNLPLEHWNVSTAHAMIIDLNAEKFGVEKYVPMRGYGYEQGRLKQVLAEYGAAAVRETIERAFAEYRPTEKYPQLTAGFLVTYILPRLMPQVLAEEQRKVDSDNEGMNSSELVDWL